MPGLVMLDDLLARQIRPEVSFDGRDGLAVFSVDGTIRWTIHFGAGHGALRWFVLVDEASGVELHVADVDRLTTEPALEHLAAQLRRDTGLH